MNYVKVLVISAILFLNQGCRNNKEERVLKGEEYFPMQLGAERFYDVDTIKYDDFHQTIDTISHVMKEEVVEQIPYGFGDTAYRIELSLYNENKDAWIPFMSFERRINGNYALEKMNNIQEVKMLFPIADYKTKGSSYTWNVNMFNSREPAIVKYTSVFKSYNNGINAYNNCVSIKLNKPQTGLVNNIREEVYAKNIGLVYRFTDSTDYLKDTAHLSGYQTYIRLK
jgi:hypothetical protein